MKVLVTGGTSGLGLGVAKQLTERGWEVTIVGRDSARGKQIASEIGAVFIRADLSLMAEVNLLTKKIEGSLDALVMCAGNISFRSNPLITSEGNETTFATNFLSKFLLSELLIQNINPNGCVVMVGGNGKHNNTVLDWSAHQSGMKAALKAALAVDLYASQLANRYPLLRVHTCYPGMIRTNLMRDAPLPFRLVVGLLGKPVQIGSSHISRLILTKHSEVHWNQSKPMLFSPPLPKNHATEKLFTSSQQLLTPYLQ